MDYSRQDWQGLYQRIKDLESATFIEASNEPDFILQVLKRSTAKAYMMDINHHIRKCLAQNTLWADLMNQSVDEMPGLLNNKIKIVAIIASWRLSVGI